MSTHNYCTYAGILMLLAALPLQAEQSEKYPFYAALRWVLPVPIRTAITPATMRWYRYHL